MSRRTSIPTLAAAAALLCACEPLLYAPVEEPRAPNQECAPPPPPEGLRVDVALDHVTLSWDVEPGAAADGYIIELRSFPEPTWGELGRVAAPPVEYGEPELPMLDDQHAFRVRAEISAGGGCSSAPTEEVVVTTLPRSPEMAEAAAFADRIRLTWRDPNDFETGYLVERRDRLIGGSFHPLAGMPLPRNTERFEDFELLEGDWRYDYKIYAVNSSGRSSAALVSQPVLVSTRAARPPEAAWVGDPYFDQSCQLVLPAHAEFDVELGAEYDAARSIASVGPSGTLVHVREEPVGSGDFYVEARLASIDPAAIEAKLSVVDTLDGRADLERSLEVGRIHAARSRGRMPTATRGDDDMEGRQILLPGCSTCSGARGSLASGAEHSCALTGDGRVVCWGSNAWGALGNGAREEYHNPVQVCGGSPDDPCAQGLSGVAAVSVGDDFVCALLDSGEARCWGDTDQVGAGPGLGTDYVTAPLPVCAQGQVGAGTCVPLAGQVDLEAGADHACAVSSDGTVRCWGVNDTSDLRLGNGVDAQRLTATPVCAGGTLDPCGAQLDAVEEVAAGTDFTCVRSTVGAVSCWGEGGSGQLGGGDSSDSPVPRAVCRSGMHRDGTCAPLLDVEELAASGSHACARLASGEVLCWGVNWQGQVGLGDAVDYVYSPSTVCEQGSHAGGDCVPLTNATALALGGAHSCALLSGGELRCWGSGDDGQLGNGDSEDGYLATPVCALGGWDGSGCVDSAMQPTPRLTGVTAVAAGTSHTCALVSGALRCWGDNDYGQLGDGDEGADRENPAPVCLSGRVEDSSCVPLPDVSAIALGYDFSCALIIGGGVKCWGKNYNGGLGDGTWDNRPYPGDVCASGSWDGAQCTDGVGPTPFTGATAIRAGEDHVCAATDGGGLVCWGRSDDGRVGDGVEYAYGYGPFNPVDVCASGAGPGCAGVGPISSFAAGDEHSCAVQSGALVCWGSNGSGQLGIGVRHEVHNPSPVCVEGGGVTCQPQGDAVAIAASNDHSCVVIESGGQRGLRCWGDNSYGQLGDGTTDDRARPVEVCASGAWDGVRCDDGGVAAPLLGVREVALGYNFSCALMEDGGVQCWGRNSSYGQLGAHLSEYDSLVPLDVCDGLADPCVPLSGVDALGVGRVHSCALIDQGGLGEVKCWGQNSSRQLGDGTTDERDGAVPVCLLGNTDDGNCQPLRGVRSLGVGYNHSCAVTAEHTVLCWGENYYGKLGGGSDSGAERPVEVCLRGSAETQDCELLTDAQAVYAGNSNTCVVRDVGGQQEVYCWGSNWSGEVGAGVAEISPVPTVVCERGVGATCEPLEGAIALTAGSSHTCALLQDGTAYCWGLAEYGQLGNGSFGGYSGSYHYTESNPVPVCAAGRSGDGSCVPLRNIVALAARFWQTCALLGDGTAACWGDNRWGQLGFGLASGSFEERGVPNPMAVCESGRGVGCTPLPDLISVAIGQFHACALTGAGQVKCWGANQVGQLGDGTTSGTLCEDWDTVDPLDYVCRPVPAEVCDHGWGPGCAPLEGVTSISLGWGQSCALIEDGSVRCWGDNQHGQLGDGTTYNAALPQWVCNSGSGSMCPRYSDFVAVAATNVSSCGVTVDGRVRCWGASPEGQLGAGDFSFGYYPVEVCGSGSGACDGTCASSMEQVVAIAGGYWHTCVLREDRTVHCWGNNREGEAGNGHTTTSLCSPVPVCSSGSGGTCAGGAPFDDVALRSCDLITVTAQ